MGIKLGLIPQKDLRLGFIPAGFIPAGLFGPSLVGARLDEVDRLLRTKRRALIRAWSPVSRQNRIWSYSESYLVFSPLGGISGGICEYGPYFAVLAKIMITVARGRSGDVTAMSSMFLDLSGPPPASLRG